jgi:hypothetical protein
MFRPTVACPLRRVKLERGNPESDEYDRMQRHRIGHQRAALQILRSRLAAAVRGGHLHLSALTLHHAAARAFFRRHLCVGSHARHSRGHTGHQQQQNRSELAQILHLTEEYAATKDVTTATTNICLAPRASTWDTCCSRRSNSLGGALARAKYIPHIQGWSQKLTSGSPWLPAPEEVEKEDLLSGAELQVRTASPI